MKIGEKIKMVRELKNISQQHIADELGISQSYYNKIEKDQSRLDFKRLSDVARILEVDPMDILNFDETNILNNNSQQGGNTANIIHVNSEHERKLYEDQIKTLKEEIVFLRNQLDSKR